jgi:hypothetical protein
MQLIGLAVVLAVVLTLAPLAVEAAAAGERGDDRVRLCCL